MRIDNDANVTTIAAEAPSTTPTEAKPVAEKESVAENKAKAAAAKVPETPAEKKARKPRLTGKLKQKKTAPAKRKPAARKAAPAKTAKPKKAETSGERRPQYRDNQVVRILPAGKENPRKPGTGQWKRYEVIRKSDGREIDEVVARGAPRTAIRYAQDCGLIEVEG